MKPLARTNTEICQYINLDKPVRVYRNLHRKCLSVMQDGKVVCHAENVQLAGVRFVVSKAGQRRVREEKRKNVHAFVEGQWCDGNADWQGRWPMEELYYNPYTCDGFTVKSTGEIVSSAKFCDLEADVNVGPCVLARL